MSGFTSNQRINQALLLLTKVLQPYVEKRLREVYRGNWQQNLSVAAGTNPSKPLDAYALLKTMLDNWQTAFRDGLKPIVRNHVSLALSARNEMAHAAARSRTPTQSRISGRSKPWRRRSTRRHLPASRR